MGAPPSLAAKESAHPPRAQPTWVNPWAFIPTSIIVLTLAAQICQELPGILLKSMGVANFLVGLSALLAIPTGLRFFGGPWVDHHGTKRQWLLGTQGGITLLTVLLAAFCWASASWADPAAGLPFLVFWFAVLALASVFLEVAWGGFFLTAIDERDKALFVGVNAAFVRLSVIFCQGLMVMVAGVVGRETNSILTGWAVAFGILAVLQCLCLGQHLRVYPYPVLDRPLARELREPFAKIFSLFFQVPRAGVILAFVFLYRLGEGMLAKMKAPFLMDAPERGGLGLSLEGVGMMTGVFTMLAMVLGGIVGGILLQRFGLRRTMFPFALIMTIPNAGFVWLAAYPVYATVTFLGVEISPVAVLVLCVEALGYGIGFASFILLLCEASRGPYRATFFALLSGIMMLCWVLAGSISGMIQEQTGYVWLFILTIVFSVPGILLVFALPLRALEASGKEEDHLRHAKPASSAEPPGS